MQTARTIQRTATTYLVHLFGSGLDRDDRFVVERYRSMADGEIEPVDDEQEKSGRTQRKTVSRRTVQRLRPKRNEIIIATAVSRDAGIQIYGDAAAGIALRGHWR